MDTPGDALISFISQTTTNKSLSCSTEDSGYITTTPNSTDYHGSCYTSTEAVNDRKSWKTKQTALISKETHTWFTPEAPSRIPFVQNKPKSLLRDAFIANSCVDFTSDNDDFMCQKATNKNVCTDNEHLRDTIVTNLNELPIQRKALKRQIALDEIEQCNSPSTSYHKDTILIPNKDSSVSEVLKNLVVVSPCDKIIHSSNACVSKVSTHKISSEDLSNSPYTCSDLITSDYVSSDQITPVQVSQTPNKYSTSPPSRKKIKRTSHEDEFIHLQRTPEKTDLSDSCLHVERKSVKRLNFSNQPLGTPEKNEILYPQLPVTPPKKRRTPEKTKHSPSKKLRTPEKTKHLLKTQKLHISRQLLGLRRQNMCGREGVDFLKMLGEQQNQIPAIQKILDSLGGEDIARMCMVSKIWRNICLKDRKASRKRRVYLNDKRLMKENNGKVIYKNVKQFRSFSDSQSARCLMEIQNQKNILPNSSQSERQRSPPVSPNNRRFTMFRKAASTEPYQLTTCLRCRRPAKVAREANGELWAQCHLKLGCGYTFCRRCLCERHEGGTCTQGSVEPPSPSKPKSSAYKIGSKQSKKNLKRL